MIAKGVFYMADDTKKKLLRKPGGKTVAAAAVLVLAGVAAWLILAKDSESTEKMWTLSS